MLLLNYLQTHHHLSRRTITNLIKEKKILINNFPVESFKMTIRISDIITIINGSKSSSHTISQNTFQTQNSQEMLLFNKPVGYTVSKSDPHNPTIYQLLPSEFQHRYYIGRLDKDSRGLVLLTPDPQLVHEYEHPSKQIIKQYLVIIDKSLSPTQLKQTKTGILSPNDFGIKETLKFKEISKFPGSGKEQKFLVKLNEGKKRHIRRVFSALGTKVLDLQRISEGTFTLGDITEGKRTIKKTF